jgi:hypothetical protein
VCRSGRYIIIDRLYGQGKISERNRYEPSEDTYYKIVDAYIDSNPIFTHVEKADDFPSEELIAKLSLIYDA